MDELTHRLSRIPTSWQILRQAHEGSGEEAAAAKQLLIERYAPAVRRYLLGGLRDPAAADELLQEFSLALVRSDFHRADPERGRFRDYVKTVLFHLVSQYRRRERKLPQSLGENVFAVPEPRDEPEPAEDLRFQQSWRETLLARAWDALSDANASYHLTLRRKAELPQATSEELAVELSRASRKTISPASVRQTIHRARELFASLLVDEVARSLTSPTIERLEEELLELDLFKYCREALPQRPGAGDQG